MTENKKNNETVNDIEDLLNDPSYKKAKGTVFKESEEIKGENVFGYDFNQGVDYKKMFANIKNMGFQSMQVGRAIEIINHMIDYRLSDDPVEKEEDDTFKDLEIRKKTRCTIFLGYTSNMASCGMREIIRFLCQHKMIDAIVTTTGGIEEDFIKCLAPFYLGDFNLSGKMLREKGINRTGNLLVPNKNYTLFEDWINPILTEMLTMQKEDDKKWTPRKIIKFLGKKINNPNSIYYWCYKNKIPVFCPALTDGSIGDMMFFHNFTHPGLIVDILADLVKINKMAISAKKTGMIILGGGVIKHHIANANLMRNGADFSVYINTAVEYDGSDSGANPDEAISWGKIKEDAERVKVFSEATLVFPIIVGETFAKDIKRASKLDDLEKMK